MRCSYVMLHTSIANNTTENKKISQDFHNPEFSHAEKVNPNLSTGYRRLNFYSLPNGASRISYVKNRSIHQGITDSIQAAECGKKKGTGLPGVSLYTQKKLQKNWQAKDFPFQDDVHYFSIGLSQPSRKVMELLGLSVHDYITKDEWSEALKAAHRSLERKMTLLDFLHVIEFTHSYNGWNNVIHSGGLLVVQRPDDMSITAMDKLISKTFNGLLIRKNPRLQPLLKAQGPKKYAAVSQKSFSTERMSFTNTTNMEAQLGQSINNKIVYTTTKAATKEGRALTQKYYDVESGQVHEGGKTYFMQKRNGLPPKKTIGLPPILESLLTDDDIETILLGMQMDVRIPGSNDERRFAVATDAMDAKDALDYFIDGVKYYFPEKFTEYKRIARKELWGDYENKTQEDNMKNTDSTKSKSDNHYPKIIWQVPDGRGISYRRHRNPACAKTLWKARE